MKKLSRDTIWNDFLMKPNEEMYTLGEKKNPNTYCFGAKYWSYSKK